MLVVHLLRRLDPVRNEVVKNTRALSHYLCIRLFHDEAQTSNKHHHEQDKWTRCKRNGRENGGEKKERKKRGKKEKDDVSKKKKTVREKEETDANYLQRVQEEKTPGRNKSTQKSAKDEEILTVLH